ncbi:acyl carrier protein, partial [Puia dinghuensis]|uniref:acyl carrier protein n=1 Tax=Puia dinghuensis TaxID=1792502 RepID=UPI00166E6546
NETVGIDDNFFSLGGDSIKAITLVSRINKALDGSLEVSHIFQHQTIATLAAAIRSGDETTSKDDDAPVLHYLREFKAQVIQSSQNKGIDITPWEDIYPLSDIEVGMIFHNQMQREAAIYHDQFFYQFEDPGLDPSKLQQAIQLLTDKHDILRAGYVLNDDQRSYKIIVRKVNAWDKTTYHDLSAYEKNDQKTIIGQHMHSDRQIGFGEEAGLWRIMIYDLGNGAAGLLISFHHAIMDGWSRASLITEMNNIYQSLKRKEQPGLQKLKTSYKDYIREQLKISADETIHTFWKEELAGTGFSGLPFKNGTFRPKEVTKRQVFTLEDELRNSMFRFSKETGIPIKNISFAVFVYLIRLSTGKEDITIGLVSDGRPALEDGEKIVGCFLNSIPFRYLFETPEPSGAGYLRSIHEKLNRLKGLDRLSLIRIKRLVGGDSPTPLFDILFSYVDFHIYREVRDVIAVDAMVDYFESTNTNFDFGFGNTNGLLGYSIAFNPTIYTEVEINNFGSYYKELLRFLLANANLPLSLAPLAPPEELMLLTDVFNRTSAVYPAHELLTAGFSKQCSLDSDSIAVYDGQQEVSYRNLDLLSQGVSGYLRKQLSVKKGHRVGIYMDRGVDMIAAMLGILQTGAVLVPIDTAYPLQRIADILMDSGLQVLITDSFYMHNLPDAFSGALMAMDLQQADFLSLPDDGHEIHLEKDDPCYLLYTSGSTG